VRLEASMKRVIKLILMLILVLLAAAVILPLVVLAGLFIWLKLTEEADDEALELDDMSDEGIPA
jgi:flagellar basal body-associated protein FliL